MCGAPPLRHARHEQHHHPHWIVRPLPAPLLLQPFSVVDYCVVLSASVEAAAAADERISFGAPPPYRLRCRCGTAADNPATARRPPTSCASEIRPWKPGEILKNTEEYFYDTVATQAVREHARHTMYTVMIHDRPVLFTQLLDQHLRNAIKPTSQTKTARGASRRHSFASMGLP